APANETERTFCDIFAGILQMDKVGASDNFFELGGTSLVVTRVIIEADKAGLHVAYGDVFANPTPRQLARLITGDTGTEGQDEVTSFDYTAINNLLQRNTLNMFRYSERQAIGNVLLTGSTGYLGIHILRELIDSDVENIYCLVRGKTQAAAESRLRSLLYYYFANAFKDLFGKRIHVILGDVTNDFDESLDIQTVFNCAAIVKHFSEGTEIEDVNIGGAKRCVDFCIKKGAKLVHISTASTRGLWAGETKDEIFTEQRLYMGQYLGNKYIYSKFMAERLILDAVALHGLSAKIMRVGNLAARSTDGEFQANFSTNSFMGRIKVYNMLGCCPHQMRNKNIEFSPINEVARAIVLLSTTPKECTVFHPYNIHGQFLGDVLMGLTTVGEGIRFVEQEEFAAVMEEAKEDPQKAKQMSSLLAYQDMAHGQKTTDVKRDNDYTTQVLYRLGFSWSPTSWDYVERMLTAIGGFGFFE
ncbi:MAG: SDR family oxidoreductase, partial [Prevotella sp.]|nr:SDR family oxidoreductase [Prevotella sp.]